MADLDDFFAKKDRKKSKSVKKFATADELAKKLEDTKKSDVRPKKERPIQEGDEPGRAGEEEEWKEYEEPVKDYTGLKIQVLQGNAAPESRDSTAEDLATDSGKVKGPWNKPVEVEQPPPPPPVEEKPKEVKSNIYVPPAPRNREVEPMMRRNQAKHAPDIHNDDYFPVLGASAKRGGAGGWSTAGAGAGGGAGAQRAGTRAPLALGNRFTSLQDDS
ncbi:Protein CDV3-like [Papilio machaon]|uniref:Protein CDV3-like n=1 Tax=Papilio machaon TaxID=76193 RepID=A0A194QZH9_PAPMA|nr:protein CDV3 homolog [Papilio machaon]KPJ10948.1 Protein CDV3-like [Papilio machaon]